MVIVLLVIALFAFFFACVGILVNYGYQNEIFRDAYFKQKTDIL